jgi:hypothetical protein
VLAVAGFGVPEKGEAELGGFPDPQRLDLLIRHGEWDRAGRLTTKYRQDGPADVLAVSHRFMLQD